MCGILGAIGSYNKESFVNAIKTLKHRGPDFLGIMPLHLKDYSYQCISESEYLNNEREIDITFAHTRLSIIDLKPEANQPFVKYNNVLIFNGEIYNYLELKEELISLGYEFYTSSDTEVLLTAYECWKETCVDRFNGMWAFSIYDSKKEVIFNSRDRFGIKPMYYYFDNNLFVFASEIKAIVKFDNIEVSANLEEVQHYLFWGLQEINKDTMFKNIFKLLPGNNLIFDLSTKKITTYEYYSINNVIPKNDITEKEAIKNLKKTFSDSCSLRMRSDVPIGVCLSGGLDSSSIVLETSKNSLNKQKTFSIVYDNNPEIDESKWINQIINDFDISNYKTTPEYIDLYENLEEFILTYDEPITGTSVFAQWYLMQFIHDRGIKVTLDGQGGDEIFGGYLYSILINFPIKSLLFKQSNASYSFLLKALAYIYMPMLYEKLLAKKISKKLNYNGKIPTNKNRPFRGKKSLDSLLKSEVTSGLRVLLKYADRSSMHFSIESRLPYLDINFVESVFSVPSKFKVKNGWTRYLQRKLFDTRLRDNIVWRKKKLGFPSPENEWINRLREEKKIQSLVSSSRILKELKINEYCEDNNLYWKIINIAVWEKRYFND